MTALTALAAATIAPPEGVVPTPVLEAAIREACAGAWRAVEVVLGGDVLRGRLGKTRDAIVRDAVEGLLALYGNAGIRADALASLRAAREAGALDGPLDLGASIPELRVQGAVAIGRTAVTAIRSALAGYRELEAVLADGELASLLLDAARAIFRTRARDPELARWAIGPTGSPARDRALSAFAELAMSPESIDELETLIAVPIALDDNVQFTVYRPRAIDPGRWHQLLAFAHLAERRPGEDDLPDPIEEVQRQAAAVLGDKAKNYAPVIQDSGAAIPAEGELTFVPEFPGIEVNPPRRSFMWLESVHREEFRIRAGRELDGKMVRGRVTVFLGSIVIAEVACAVRVDASRPEPKREPTSVRAYRKIFASYSHRDLEVVNQFETYARALGDEYLRDWVHLRTGEVWTDRLCQLIEQADAFQLFWSRNSMHSGFVRQEYEHALSLGRPSFVRPTYWEDPMPTAPGLPPEALLRLHFQKLGGGLVGAAGRTDSPASEAKLSRKKRVEMDRERADTKVDRMAVEYARKQEHEPIGADAADLDVTDPQYSLPEMPTAEASSSMPVEPPVSFDEEVPSTLDTARVRSVTTEPGIGTVKPPAAQLKTMLSSPPRSPITTPDTPQPRAPAPVSVTTPPMPSPSRPAPRPPPGYPAAAPPAMPSPSLPETRARPVSAPAIARPSASDPAPMRAPLAMPIVASQRPPGPLVPPAISQPPPEPIDAANADFAAVAPSPIPTTTPGVGPSGVSIVRSSPPDSPWSRPDHQVLSQGAPVSPYAPTVPLEAYDPRPSAFAPPPSLIDPAKKRVSDSIASQHRSKLPLVLISIGVLALLAVLLIWLSS